MLDCRTPRGRESIKEQKRTQEILESIGYRCISTSEDDSDADVIIATKSEGWRIRGIAEIKTRSMAGDKPITEEYIRANGYLITANKIERCVEVAAKLRTSFFVIVRLLNDSNKILVWEVWDKQYLFEFDTRKSKTAKTTNGGIANRVNAFLPLNKAKIIEYKDRK